jgi:hypothetical protein
MEEWLERCVPSCCICLPEEKTRLRPGKAISAYEELSISADL